jgi:hypothetical protein
METSSVDHRVICEWCERSVPEMEKSMTGRESQAMSAEQSAGTAGREVESEEQSELEAEGQASGTKQFVYGAKRKGLHTGQSASNSGRTSRARSAPGE